MLYEYVRTTCPDVSYVHEEVASSAMTDKGIEWCRWDDTDDNLQVNFTNELSGGDKTILDGIIVACPEVCDAAHEIHLKNGDKYVGFKAPEVLNNNTLWTLPDIDGLDGQVMKTDGSKKLSFGTIPTHTQNTDTKLDEGGADEVAAIDAKDAVDKKHLKDHDHSEGGISRIVTEGIAVNAITSNISAIGTSDISTTSTSYVDMPDMNVIMTTGNKAVLFMFTAPINPDTSGQHCYARLIVDGEVKTYGCVYNSGGYNPLTLLHIEILSAEEHTVKVQWKVTGGTAYNWPSTFELRRTLIAIELKR